MRKSQRIVSFLILSSSKIEKASHNCFALDFVKFNNLGFAELFCFLMLSSSKIEEVSQNCFGPGPSKVRIYIIYIFNNIY